MSDRTENDRYMHSSLKAFETFDFDLPNGLREVSVGNTTPDFYQIRPWYSHGGGYVHRPTYLLGRGNL